MDMIHLLIVFVMGNVVVNVLFGRILPVIRSVEV